MTHKGFREADFESLAGLWRTFYPKRFHVDAQQIRLNTVESPVFDWGASRFLPGDQGPLAFVAIKKSGYPLLYSGPDPDQAHLSAIAFVDPGVGIDLMAYAKRVLRNRGTHKIVFGQDSRHFFSGCPDDCSSIRSFLLVEGFEEDGEIVDLERDLGDYEPKKGCLDLLGDWPGCKSPTNSKPSVSELKANEIHELERFLRREFPGRWTYDTIHKIETEGQTNFVYVLRIDGHIEGFASTQESGHRLPVCGGVWRLDLGENWGALGPIGVSERIRRKGFGDALLGGALLGLQSRGVMRTIIDWTGLSAFYGGHGFEISRRYKSFSLDL